MGESTESVPPERLEGKFLATVVCCILGLGSLVAWNTMLTVGDYYYEVYPTYHPSRVFTVVYEPFALGTILILTYYESKINTRKRNIWGYIIFAVATLMLIVLDLATSGRGGPGTYIGVLVFVACFGVGDALVQGGLVGDLSFMCPEFLQSFMGGVAVAGALTSCLRLITKAMFDKSPHGLRKGALLFLGISTLIEVMCIFLYAFLFPRIPIVKYYRAKAAAQGATTVQADLAAVGLDNQTKETNDSETKRLTNKELLFQNLDYCLSLALIYIMTLSIFPGFLFENTGKHQLGTWYAVVLIAAYNGADLVSRYIPLIKCLTLQSRKGILVSVLARFLLVPAFYFTGKYADQGWMIFVTSFLGLTNGYLTVCVFTAAPKGYKAPETNALGNILVVFLLGGIFAGVCLGWLWTIGKNTF